MSGTASIETGLKEINKLAEAMNSAAYKLLSHPELRGFLNGELGEEIADYWVQKLCGGQIFSNQVVDYAEQELRARGEGLS